MYVQTESTVILGVLVSASFVCAHTAQCSSLPVFSSERAVTSLRGTNLTRKKQQQCYFYPSPTRVSPERKETNRRCCLCNYLYTTGWI